MSLRMLNLRSSSLRHYPRFRFFSTDSNILLRDVTLNNDSSQANFSNYLYGMKNETKSFGDFGLSSQIIESLHHLGFSNATVIQANAIPNILEGKNTIVAAETGSGKTLAYLIPLIEKALQYKRSPRDSISHSTRLDFPKIVILIPNKELGQQALKVAQSILQSSNSSNAFDLAIEVHTSVSNEWPYFKKQPSTHTFEDDSFRPAPDILITVPAFLSQFVKGGKLGSGGMVQGGNASMIQSQPTKSRMSSKWEGSSRGEEGWGLGMFSSIKHLVLDEADMLLEGSYELEMNKIWNGMKEARKYLHNHHSLPSDSPSHFQSILSAASIPSRGKQSVQQKILKRFPGISQVSNPHLHQHHPLIRQRYIQVSEEDVLSPSRISLLANSLLLPLNLRENNEQPSLSSSSLTHHFPITLPSYSSLPITLIFVNTAQLAQQLAEKLRQMILPPSSSSKDSSSSPLIVEYHKLISHEEKMKNLETFRCLTAFSPISRPSSETDSTSPTSSSSSVILSTHPTRIFICTDNASRGLDLPHVQRVVQAEMALNVVAHLHRIGRASRGGRKGDAIMIYDKRGELLVDAILQDAERRQTIQKGEKIDENEKDLGLMRLVQPEGEESEELEPTTLTDSDPRFQDEDGLGSLVQAFSRRRGMRHTLKKQLRDQRMGMEGMDGGEMSTREPRQFPSQNSHHNSRPFPPPRREEKNSSQYRQSREDERQRGSQHRFDSPRNSHSHHRSRNVPNTYNNNNNYNHNNNNYNRRDHHERYNEQEEEQEEDQYRSRYPTNKHMSKRGPQRGGYR